MSKIVSKNQILKKAFFLLFFMLLFGPVFADSKIEFDMFSLWNKAFFKYQEKKYDQEKLLPTNLFKIHEEQYSTKKKAQILKGISATKEALNAQYASCSLSNDQIATILFFTNDDFARELRKTIEGKRLPKREVYETTCKKLTSCIEGEATINLNKKCEDIINENYSFWWKNQARKFIVEESNLWKDKYQNGNIEDSAYDLLYDIGQIGKILFDDTKSPTEMLFYRLPNFPSQTSPKNWNQASASLNLGNQKNWNQNNPSLSGSDQGIGWENVASISQSSNGISDDPTISQFIQAKNGNKTTLVNRAFVNNCVVVGSPILESLQYQNAEASLPSPFSISEKDLDKMVADILKNSDTIKQTTAPNLPRGQEVGGIQLSDNMNLLNDIKKQLESCTKKCDGLRRDERQVCKLQCLCKEYHSPALAKNATFHFLEEWAFKLRICTIPSKVVLVNTRSKMLYTIESVLREIQDSINGLYESGELTTKTKTKEFFDTSLSKYKFSKNISFILGIGKTPSTTNPNEKQEQKAEESFTESLKENIFSTENERNRYVIIDTYDTTKNSRSIRKTVGVPQKNENFLTPSTVLTQHKFAVLNDQVSDYLDRNANLLLEINDKLKELDQVLRSLSQKK